MTERAAKKWEQQRALGRPWYYLRQGSRFFAVIAILHLLSNNSVPWEYLALAGASGSALCAALAYFRWDYMELQYSLFQKSQGCSENAFYA